MTDIIINIDDLNETENNIQNNIILQGKYDALKKITHIAARKPTKNRSLKNAENS